MVRVALVLSLLVGGCSGGSTSATPPSSSSSTLPAADAGRDAPRPLDDAALHLYREEGGHEEGGREAGASSPDASSSSRASAASRSSTRSEAPDGGRDGSTDGARPHDAAHDATLSRDAGHDSGPGVAILTGAVQKGPFILGSSVSLSAISASASPSGQVFSTTTTDDLGDFDVTFAYSGDVDMQASGFYYDEVTGALSAAPITLSALYNVASPGPQDTFINTVTHLAHGQAVALMQGGATLATAEAQAETNLVGALGIGGSSFSLGSAGIALNELGANSQANAYLFAVSATMVETVIQQDGTTSLDANLQELLDTISSDLARTGTLPPSVTGPILTAEQALDVDLVTDLFALRLAAVGSSATPANLDLAIDSDGDGYVNSVDTCPLVANPDQSVIPTGVLCAVSRHTSFLPAGTAALVAPPLVADFEGTGHAGVLYGDTAGWSLALGDGTGRLAPPSAVALPASFTPLLAVDLNKDGNLDLVGESGWVAGNGAGAFGALSSFGAAFTTGLVVADFNGDKVPDVAGISASGLTVLLATNRGVFGPAVSSASLLSDATLWLTAVDVNDDGKMDIVAAGSAGDDAVFFGAGNGSFNAAPVTAIRGSTSGAAVADFDGDGFVDLAEWGGSTVTIGFGDGQGNFPSLATTRVSSTALAAGDFNADGKTDLWVGYDGACDSSGDVLLSAGRTFFAPQALHATPASCPGGFAVVAHDLTGDGTPGVVVVSEGGDGLAWNLQGYVIGGCPGCACPGRTCGGVCVDTQTDWFNCGGCGGTCALGATCVGGKCACAGSDAVCGDACVDKSTNLLNCGKCGNKCRAVGQTCTAGECTCLGTAKVCGAACVDESSDSSHCGSCTTACAEGEACVSAMCISMSSSATQTTASSSASSTGTNTGTTGEGMGSPSNTASSAITSETTSETPSETTETTSSGSTSQGCNLASDCPTGHACDPGIHACVTACGQPWETECNGGCCNEWGECVCNRSRGAS